MNIKKNSYKYSITNLLNNPQNYQMSEFEGIKFLDEYQNSRNNILKKIKEKCDKIIKIEEILNDYEEYENIDENIDTEKILKTCLKNIFLSKFKDREIILKLIKKFEIKKLIYTKYNNLLKENSEQYKNIFNYILLSCICLNLYEQEKNLKFLNVALKLNDVIISQFDFIFNLKELSMLNYNLDKELKLSKSLMKLKGIKME